MLDALTHEIKKVGLGIVDLFINNDERSQAELKAQAFAYFVKELRYLFTPDKSQIEMGEYVTSFQSAELIGLTESLAYVRPLPHPPPPQTEAAMQDELVRISRSIWEYLPKPITRIVIKPDDVWKMKTVRSFDAQEINPAQRRFYTLMRPESDEDKTQPWTLRDLDVWAKINCTQNGVRLYNSVF